jgi:hypothetical protein
MKIPSVFLLTLLVAPALTAADESLFSSDTRATREQFRKLCDYIAAEKKDVRTIFTAGYYMRDLVAGYRIFGEKRYLDVAVEYADGLLQTQSDRGYWGTGYGTIYLADTGSALGLFIALSPHVDQARRKQYLGAAQRYADAIQRDGLINPSGAFGTGFRLVKKDAPLVLWRDEYTISSALTGNVVYMWMYRATGQSAYQTVAHQALSWIFGTMRGDGAIPYVLAGQGGDWTKRGDPKADYALWDKLPYLTSAYVGEGILFFDKYCKNAAWKKELHQRVRPHIEFLLRAQSPEGHWRRDRYRTEADRIFDLTRTPGIANLLIWYYREVHKDRRVLEAVRKFNRYLLDPENAKAFGVLTAGATIGPGRNQIALDSATSLAGRALADIIRPGVDVP